MSTSQRFVLVVVLAGLVSACDAVEGSRAEGGAVTERQADSASQDAWDFDLTTVSTPANPDLIPGFELYQSYCAACHGPRGEGAPDWKRTLEDGSLPPPPHDSSGHTWHHSDAQLLEIISEGGVVYMPESRMPGYAGVLSQSEMRSVLEYIKTFWGQEEKDFQADMSRQWEETYGLTDTQGESRVGTPDS